MQTIILRDECGDRVLKIIRVNEIVIDPIRNDDGEQVSQHWRLDFICNVAGEPAPNKALVDKALADVNVKTITVNGIAKFVALGAVAKYDDVVRLAGFSKGGTFAVRWDIADKLGGPMRPGMEIKVHGGEVFTVTPVDACLDITVNGKPYRTVLRAMGYEDVIKLAGFSGDPTVTWRSTSDKTQHMAGILHRGQEIVVVGGEVFNVADTSNA